MIKSFFGVLYSYLCLLEANIFTKKKEKLYIGDRNNFKAFLKIT